jgi:hypothetical protein
MNPLRGDVVLVGLLLSVPVLAMGLRGDFSAEEVVIRVLWCLAAGWGVVTVLRLASTPRVVAADPLNEEGSEPASVESERSPAV